MLRQSYHLADNTQSNPETVPHSAHKSIPLCFSKEPTKGIADGSSADYCSRERLKRHRTEMAGRVWIPEIWGQERMLKDWVDCSAFDSDLVPNGLASAREALVEECRKLANSGRFRIENPC